jgi:hypothetical protein
MVHAIVDIGLHAIKKCRTYLHQSVRCFCSSGINVRVFLPILRRRQQQRYSIELTCACSKLKVSIFCLDWIWPLMNRAAEGSWLPKSCCSDRPLFERASRLTLWWLWVYEDGACAGACCSASGTWDWLADGKGGKLQDLENKQYTAWMR